MSHDALGISGHALLAPMAAVTDIPFRTLCFEQGAAAAVTEFISAHALARGVAVAQEKAHVGDDEGPVVLQIFGEEPDAVAAAVRWADGQGCYAGVDLNFGCPAPKILRQGAGSALLSDPRRMQEIVRSARRSTSLPVSAKIRTGVDARSVNAVTVAQALEQSGVQFITVHGRTLRQGYRGKADWAQVKAVAAAVSIPVIGNGDVIDGPTAAEMMQETCCAAVMVGRAARTDPSVFADIEAYLRTGKRDLADTGQRMALVLRYLDLAERHGFSDFVQIRQHAVDMTKGMEGSARLRQDILACHGVEPLRSIIMNFKYKKTCERKDEGSRDR